MMQHHTTSYEYPRGEYADTCIHNYAQNHIHTLIGFYYDFAKFFKLEWISKN